MGVNALRAYLRELRKEKAISQEELAEVVGLSRRTLIDWEMGRTDDIKSTPLIRAASFLGASLQDIQHLVETDVGEDVGKRLAWERIHNIKSTQETTDRGTDLVKIIELALRWRNDPRLTELAAYVEKLQEGR